MDELLAAAIAGTVSVTVGLISFFATRSKVRSELLQTQFGDILKKRIEIYPKLWAIHIRFETNWTIDRKPKDQDWATQYLSELNAFNVEGGLFFSQELYSAFHQLRTVLVKAVDETLPGEAVRDELTTQARRIVYGHDGRPGLSTHLKDDLGSYRAVALQRRSAPG